jgi:hypothetical protein
MSNGGASKSVVLNWRGLLLSAGIFAAVFAILLLMAHQNESKTSDMGSSLREDPYGTSLMFDSYGRTGYQVMRGQHEDSLADQDATKTTAFFIGGYSPNDWITNGGKIQTGTKFRGRLERFLASGGRVVLVEPSWEIKSESQGWEVANKWDKTSQEHTLPRVLPDLSAMPADSEAMFLGADAPWLQTDAQWTVLYRGSTGADAKGETPACVYLATRRVGNGELIAASQEFFLLNEAIKTHPNPVLLDFLAGGRPVIWVDETLHGLRQSEGVLWLVQRYRLETALLLFWATLLALLWNMSGDLVRRPANNSSAQIVRNAEAAGVAGRRLLQRNITKDRVLAECWEQFRRCWPQDARAISEDPLSGERLNAALKLPPIEGYKEIRQLIVERRVSAKGLASVRPDATGSSRFDR